MKNFVIPRKKLVIALKPSDPNVACGALGALGRRFESSRPDHLKPNRTREFPRLSFLLFAISSEEGALERALASSMIH